MTNKREPGWEARDGDLPSHPHDRRSERKGKDERRQLDETGFDNPTLSPDVQALLDRSDGKGQGQGRE